MLHPVSAREREINDNLGQVRCQIFTWIRRITKIEKKKKQHTSFYVILVPFIHHAVAQEIFGKQTCKKC